MRERKGMTEPSSKWYWSGGGKTQETFKRNYWKTGITRETCTQFFFFFFPPLCTRRQHLSQHPPHDDSHALWGAILKPYSHNTEKIPVFSFFLFSSNSATLGATAAEWSAATYGEFAIYIFFLTMLLERFMEAATSQTDSQENSHQVRCSVPRRGTDAPPSQPPAGLHSHCPTPNRAGLAGFGTPVNDCCCFGFIDLSKVCVKVAFHLTETQPRQCLKKFL